MNTKIRIYFCLLLLFYPAFLYGKTPSKIFEMVSPTVVLIRTYDILGKAQSFGSGVIVEKGVVATNAHVVKNSSAIRVVSQKMEYAATILHLDSERDVCTLSVAGLKGEQARKGKTKSLKIGERVYVIGAPQGLELTLSDGLISGLRPVPGGQYLQITAPISPGSSGGGLFDSQGRLIGLPTFYLTEGQQLNFAVPVEWIDELQMRNSLEFNPGKKTSNEWHNESIELFNTKDWAKSIDHDLRWVKEQPQNPIAWYCLGISFHHSGQKTISIEALMQAIKLDPEYENAWWNIGVNYADLGEPAKAINAYHQAIRINPNNSYTWSMTGQAYRQTGQIFKAIEADQQALSIDPNEPVILYNAGVNYRYAGHFSKVMNIYRLLKVINPSMAAHFYYNIIQK